PAAGGNTVTIKGASLQGATSVKFGALAGKIVTVSKTGTSLTVKAPAQGTSPNAVNVQVTTKVGSTPISDAAMYSFGPLISKVTPAVGAPGGGTKVKIVGKNFTGVAQVKFGSATVNA